MPFDDVVGARHRQHDRDPTNPHQHHRGHVTRRFWKVLERSETLIVRRTEFAVTGKELRVKEGPLSLLAPSRADSLSLTEKGAGITWQKKTATVI